MSMSVSVLKETVTINGYPMYYERRGTGSHYLLLIPGALGTGVTNFSNQHSGFDLTKFTLISVDLVGYGKSRPAKRRSHRHYWFDAECCHILMREKLQKDHYSILGFSDGGRVGLILGATYPKEITKIVAVGCSCYVTPEEKSALQKIRDISSWSPESRAESEDIYGKELQTIWNAFLDAYFEYTDIFKKEIPNITCPVFVLHGEYDSIVFVEHAHYFKNTLADVKLYVHTKGPHYFHIKYYEIFNKMVQEFLLQ